MDHIELNWDIYTRRDMDVGQNDTLPHLLRFLSDRWDGGDSFQHPWCICNLTLFHIFMYCKVSNISPTKSQNLNVSCLVLQLSLPNPLKLGVKSGMKM